VAVPKTVQSPAAPLTQRAAGVRFASPAPFPSLHFLSPASSPLAAPWQRSIITPDGPSPAPQSLSHPLVRRTKDSLLYRRISPITVVELSMVTDIAKATASLPIQDLPLGQADLRSHPNLAIPNWPAPVSAFHPSPPDRPPMEVVGGSGGSLRHAHVEREHAPRGIQARKNLDRSHLLTCPMG
jgi:hypothetical protein